MCIRDRKDGSANRGDCDFCSVIALEIEDTGSHTFTCIGIAFEVRKNDSEIKRFVYFSHSGRMPEPSYVTADGFCYSNNDIKKLVNTRSDVYKRQRYFFSDRCFDIFNISVAYSKNRIFCSRRKEDKPNNWQRIFNFA